MKKFAPFLPLLFWLSLAAITFLMLIELPPKEDGIPYVDKIQHAVVFMLLSIIGIKAYKAYQWQVLAGLVTYGAVIELLQSQLTVTRQASVYDWLADIVGILIAIGIMYRRLSHANFR